MKQLHLEQWIEFLGRNFDKLYSSYLSLGRKHSNLCNEHVNFKMKLLNWKDNRIHNFSTREYLWEGRCNSLTEERDITIDAIMGLSEKLKTHEDLLKENQALKNEVNVLTNYLAKLTKRKDTFNKLFGKQQFGNEKGLDLLKNQKIFFPKMISETSFYFGLLRIKLKE